MGMTRDFLSMVLPWEQAGDGVFYNVHFRYPAKDPKPGRTHFWGGRACSSLDDLERAIKFWGQGTNDVYICMSSQSRCEEKTTKSNKKYRSAIRFQANVVGLQSFYIDVDVKPEAYKTQAEAIEAFRLFCQAVDLPDPSTVVTSGSGGFHAHWCVERPLSLAEWQPVANALSYACQEEGLICDTQCTIDSARILRVPGTLNHKTTPPNQVGLLSLGQRYLFDDLRERLEPYIGKIPTGNTTAALIPFERRAPIITPSELSAGIQVTELPDPEIKDVAEQCPFIRETLANGGQYNANPAWYMALNIASFCADGENAAHELSFGHDSYTYEETEAQFDRIQSDHKARDIGWPSCVKIQNAGAVECAGCPLLRAGKSPLNFVTPKLPAQVTPVASGIASASVLTDVWPEKYSRRSDGFIYFQEGVDDQGMAVEKKICPYNISEGWVQKDPWTLHFTAVTSVGKTSRVEVQLSELGGMGGARKTLGDCGMVFNDRDYKMVQEFLMAWIQKLQTQKDSVVSSVPYGWADYEDGKSIEGFAFAGRIWGQPGKDRQATVTDQNLAKLYTPKGELDVWKQTARLVTDQKRPALDIILACSFAAPLMRFIGHNGLLVSAYSTTGVGKSSAIDVALSVWGNPAGTKHGLNDTGNHTFKKLGQTKALPIFWDELQKREDILKFAAHVFPLTGGQERNRLGSSNGKLKIAEAGTWQTLMFSACNMSLIDTLLEQAGTHTAGLARTFEFEVARVDKNAPGRMDVAKATQLFAQTKNNYGWAGLRYAQFLGANHVRIEKETKALAQRIDNLYHAEQEERYWTSSIAMILQGAEYANELGLTEIGIPQMQDFLLETLEKMRSAAKNATVDLSQALNVSSLVQEFMGEMRTRHTLITNRIHIGVGKPQPGVIQVKNDPKMLDGLWVQIGTDDGLVRISASQLSNWLKSRKPYPIPKMAFLKAFKEQFNFRMQEGFLGAGTSYRSFAKERLYEIDANDFPTLVQE